MTTIRTAEGFAASSANKRQNPHRVNRRLGRALWNSMGPRR